MWLVDLCVRLSLGDQVVFFEPGRQYEAALRVVANRDVQAFVIAPAQAVQGAGVSIFGSPS
jgi:hypothetical protein